MRCTFWGNGKTHVAQNSCNLSYLIRQRQEHKKLCSLRFSLHEFVHLKFFGPYSKTSIVKVRATWGRVSRGLTVLTKTASCLGLYEIDYQFQNSQAETLLSKKRASNEKKDTNFFYSFEVTILLFYPGRLGFWKWQIKLNTYSIVGNKCRS